MRQSTHVKTRQPACLLAVFLMTVTFAVPGHGQEQFEVNRRENFRREPSPTGRLLASIEPGARVMGLQTRDGWVQITLEGWVWERSLRPPTDDDEFDLEVIPPAGENVRESPNGRPLGRLGRGFLAQEVERADGWVRIRRTGWMFGPSLTSVATGAPVDSAAQIDEDPAVPTPSGRPVSLDYAVTDRLASVHREADGDTAGTVRSGTPVRIISRSGRWVKIQTEGWVLEDDLRAPAEDMLVGVTGAEVRATPSAFEGQVLQWRVHYLSTKTGTGVRPLIPEGAKYMLARGPLPEAGFVYVLVNDDQAAQLQRVSGIAELVILGRLLGVSRFIGNPVVELIEMQIRSP